MRGSRVCWRWIATRSGRPPSPHSEIARRAALDARDDERASRDERRLLNRLRADLLAVFPALDFADFDLGAPTVLRVLERWPTAQELATVSREELVAFARAGHNSQAERFADKVRDALSVDHFEAPAHLVRAKVTNSHLGINTRVLIPDLMQNRPGNAVLCEPSCTAVFDN